MTGVQTPMSGRIHPDEVSLNKTVGPYQLRVRWGGYAVSDPALWPPQRDGKEKSFSLEGSIKNHINIHDVYQSKSGSSVCSASLILSLSAVLEKLWICKALTALLFFSKTNISRKPAGKADICWPGSATAAKWQWGVGERERGESETRSSCSWGMKQFRNWCPRRREQKTLKETQGAKLPSHEPRWKDASRLTSQLKRNHPECF